MTHVADAYVAHERTRFMRPDSHRWVRSDAARFLKPGTDVASVFPTLDRKYAPNQPRVPAGSGRESGRWTDGGGGNGINDPRVIPDSDRDVAAPGERYAQNRPRSGGRVLINGQQVELTPAQGARLSAAQAGAQSAIARIREIDPNWRPPQSAYQTPEGLIQAYQADAAAAQARSSELAARGALPGPFAGDSIPARGPGRSITLQERDDLNRIGSETGCHTCGKLESGTPSGNFFADHQLPTRINPAGRAQRLYPQCVSCSASQGPFVRDLQK
jgi:hypothetical protein